METIKELFASETAPMLIRTISTAIVAIIAANIVLNVIKKALEKTNKVSKALIGFAYQVTRFLVYFFVFIFIANALGINTSSIVALASVLSAAIALAAQNVLSNLFGGVTLILTHPFDLNDFITVSNNTGLVTNIGIFYTVLQSADCKVITIPNGTVASSTIINYSKDGRRRVDVNVSASYDCKLDDVKAALYKAINRTANILPENQFVNLCNYGSSAIEYSIKVLTKNENYWQVYFDLIENVKRSFDEDGISMTYNHIIVHNSKD